jgi:hypothetical protein
MASGSARAEAVPPRSGGQAPPLNETELAALRGAGMSDVDIAAHLSLNSDIFLFRGTSSGWEGNPGSQSAVSASVDPYAATIFALEARGQGGTGVVQFGARADIGSLETGNLFASREGEVSIAMSPTEFAVRAPNTISVDTARAILEEMGMPPLPRAIFDTTDSTSYLQGAPRMTPEQVAEFIARARTR